MSTISERILNLIREKQLSYGELSAMTGIAKASIQRYATGASKISLPRLESIADALNVSAAYLMGWEEQPAPKLPENLIPIAQLKLQRIPVVGSVAAGVPILAEEEHGVTVDSTVEADYALRVEGDSMAPKYLNGDMIYIKAQPDVDDGQIAVILIDDSATLKHVYHIKNGVQLVSENPKYPPMLFTYPDCDTIRILGIVVGYLRIY